MTPLFDIAVGLTLGKVIRSLVMTIRPADGRHH